MFSCGNLVREDKLILEQMKHIQMKIACKSIWKIGGKLKKKKIWLVFFKKKKKKIYYCSSSNSVHALLNYIHIFHIMCKMGIFCNESVDIM